MAQQRNFLAPHWSETSIARILGPMQQFVNRSASSGIILMLATVVALALANSGLAQAYNDVLHTEIGFTIGPYAVHEDLLHWINDGLMAIFFFLVGLEIKREVRVGELANVRAATLPIVAALGGVIVPATIYMLFNFGGIGSRGWGVPMATDIAFALGCLALLGDRIPFALKIFLTAVAIVDDLIAVLVIAFFYSGGLNFVALGLGFALLVVLLLANIFGIRSFPLYIGLGFVIWLAFLESGVHATIAGVLIALTIPARNRIDAPTFLRRAHRIIHHFQEGELEPTPMLTDERQQSSVIELEALCEQVQAPLQKMEHFLHNWVSFLIMPIFAFANAGVTLSIGTLGGETLFVSLGIIFGLTLGKPIGLLVASWLAVRSGFAALPEGVTWQHMIGAGILAGIGFTMSLFIASLGFSNPDVLATAKFSILIASLLAGSVGLVYLSRIQPVQSAAADAQHVVAVAQGVEE
jgi:NhaA family Na+:H+ antiporter